MAHAFRDTAKGDSKDLRARLQEVAAQLEDRKRAATLLNTENQRLKCTVRDLEGRLVLSESGSGARDAVGECAALRAFKNTIGEYKAAENAKTAQLEAAHARNAALQQELQDLQAVNASLKDDLESMHQAMSATSSSLSATVYRLEHEQRALQQAYTDSQAAASNLEAQRRALEAAFEEQKLAMQRLQQQLFADGQQQLLLAREAASQEQAAAVAAVQAVVCQRDTQLQQLQEQLQTAMAELAGAKACMQAALQCDTPPTGWSMQEGRLSVALERQAPSAAVAQAAVAVSVAASVLTESLQTAETAAAEVCSTAGAVGVRQANTYSSTASTSAVMGLDNTLGIMLHDLAVQPGLLGMSKDELWPLLSVQVPGVLHSHSVAECGLGQAAPLQQLLCCQMQVGAQSLQWLRSAEATAQLLNARACLVGAFKCQMPDGQPQELAAVCVALQNGAITIMLCTLTAAGAPGTVVAVMADASSCMQAINLPHKADGHHTAECGSTTPDAGASSSTTSNAAASSTTSEAEAAAPAKPGVPSGVLVAAATLDRSIYGAARLSGLFEELRETVNLPGGQQCAVWRLRTHSQRVSATKQNIGREVHVAADPMAAAAAAPLATCTIPLTTALSNPSSDELGRQALQQFLQPAVEGSTAASCGMMWEATESTGTTTLQLLSSRAAPAAQLRATVRLRHSVQSVVPLVERLQQLEEDAQCTAAALAAATEAAAVATADAAAMRAAAEVEAAVDTRTVSASTQPSQRLSCTDAECEEDVQPLGSVHLLGTMPTSNWQHGQGVSARVRYGGRAAAIPARASTAAENAVGVADYDDGASTDSEDCEEGVSLLPAEPVVLQTIVYGEEDGPEPEDSFMLAATGSLAQPLQ